MTDNSDDWPSPRIEDRFPRIRFVTDPIAVGIASFLAGPPDDKSRDRKRKEVAQEEFERAFASRSVVYLLVVIMSVALIGLLDSQITNFPRQVYGLVIDLIGAVILGRGLLSSPRGIVAKATAGMGGPLPTFRAHQSQDAVDGIWGISLLIIGIFTQGIAVVGVI